MKDHLRYFQILLLGVLPGMEPTRYLFSDIDAVTITFHVLEGKLKYVFPQLQTCSVDCAEGSFSSNILSNVFQFFNFPFFNLEQ